MKKMKSLISGILLAALVALCLPAAGLKVAAATVAAGTCGDNVSWTLDDAGKLTISGSGSMQNYSSSQNPPWDNYKESIISVVIENDVTSIGDYAFEYCESLNSVTISDSVTTIGKSAFGDCESLSSVIIPNSVTTIGESAFGYCEGLSSVIIPDSVTTIGESAFEYCEGLSSVIISNSVTTIGESAFYGCSSLTSLDVPKGVTVIEDSTFEDCRNLASVSIPEGVVSIGDYAFEGCSSLTSVTIPESVTSISDFAFRECTGLTSLQVKEGNTAYHSDGNCIIETGSKTLIVGCKTSQIPTDGSVTSIENAAFRGCSGLTSITIPGCITDIDYATFEGCTNLSSVTIMEGVTSIDSSAFRNCTSLTGIVIPSTVSSIGNWAFQGCNNLVSLQVKEGNPVYHSAGNCIIETESKTLVVGCKTSQIPADGSVTVIGDSAFMGCTGMTAVTIPEGIIIIDEYAFSDCGLTSVTIPSSVRSIGYSAFENCTSLTEVTISEGVVFIDEEAFSDCSNLTSVTIPSTVASIGCCAFDYCSELKTIYYNGTTAQWETIVKDEEWDRDCNYTLVCLGDSQNAEELAYTLSADGTYYIVAGIGTCTDTDLLIPATYKGLPVKEIGASAFRDNTAITSVTIPEGVETVGNYAFSGCTGLTSLTLPDSLQTIGQSAFNKCSGLTSVSIPGNIKSIGYHAFYNCPKLTYTAYGNAKYLGNAENPYLVLVQATSEAISSCAVHPDTRILYGEAFFCCTQLTELTVPKGVVEVGPYLFDASGVKKVYFDGSAPSFAKNAFSGVSAAAYYWPDSTWTEDVMQDYGGDITWIPLGSDVKLSITSFGAAADGVTVQLIPSGETEAAYTLTTADSPANSGSWTLSGVKPGAYTVTLSKKNHVTRTYALTVGDAEASLEAQLWLLGDVNGDGLVNFSDYSKVLSQAKNPNAGALEGYALACADVTADGMVNFSDYAKVLSQAKGNSALW